MKLSDINSLVSSEALSHFLKVPEVPDLAGDSQVSMEAIDIGFGYTKFTRGMEGGEIKTGLFPSITPLSPQSSMTGDFFMARDTKKVDFGGTVWEVGPDVEQIVSKSDVRALHENFIGSEQWMVLFLGALAYIGNKDIDLLVLGLPVSSMAKTSVVEKAVVGEHIIDGETYTVKAAHVIPQPLGALYAHAAKSQDFRRFANTNTLVVDPGYLTFDFLVTRGLQINENRSGARPGGMSAVLSAMATSISQMFGIKYDNLEEIDAALNLKEVSSGDGNNPLWVAGKEVDLNPHKTPTKPVIEASMNFMLNNIGDADDIAQIIMAGGPNKIFERAIRKQFPDHALITDQEGIFANVKGFYIRGAIVALGQAIQSSRAA